MDDPTPLIVVIALKFPHDTPKPKALTFCQAVCSALPEEVTVDAVYVGSNGILVAVDSPKAPEPPATAPVKTPSLN